MSQELFFVDDQPKIVFYSRRYALVRPGFEEHTFNDEEYYIANATSFAEAIEIMRLRIQQALSGRITESQKNALIAGLSQIIDGERGIGFTLMIMDLSDWVDILEDVEEGIE